jgi:2-oxo-4-hydroxy-4-carboxy-5-ureidoimidazoline decarboxylase
VRIDDFNAMSPDQADAAVRPCADIGSWVQALVAGRPYDAVADLLAVADLQARTWSPAEVTAALADHPRIGERHAGTGASAQLSGREQAGVDAQDLDVQRRLAAGNAAYEERFDRIFLVRAAGRSAAEILALLDERLTNDPDTELAVTAGQLREIALLRLEGLFA